MKLAVILHDIRSVHNVGSIFRTADAVGAEKIYLCGITPIPFDRFHAVRSDFAKVALGAEKSVAWEHAADTMAVMARLKEEGYQLCALEQAHNSIPYHALRVRKEDRIALVLGPEVEGIPREILDRVDTILEIPMAGAKESLNVSVAFGIAAFRMRYNDE